MKDAIELHCGDCRIKCFRILTNPSDLKSEYLGLHCIPFDHLFFLFCLCLITVVNLACQMYIHDLVVSCHSIKTKVPRFQTNAHTSQINSTGKVVFILLLSTGAAKLNTNAISL